MFHRNQAGDTIVEVLICISVIGAVLLGAYAASSNSLRSLQDAQERTQAQKLVETQLERLRDATKRPGSGCFLDVTMETVGTCMIAKSANSQPVYTMSISTPDGSGTYTVSAKWVRQANGNGQSNVTMYYRPL